METDKTDTSVAIYTNEPERFGRLVSQKRRDETPSYFHFDLPGSTRTITDVIGDATDTATYSAFGKLIARTGTTVSPFGFIGSLGYLANSDDDEFYVRARMYNANIARWLSIDPIGTRDTANVYLYGLNNPINHLDPSGWQPICCCCCPLQLFADYDRDLVPPRLTWSARIVNKEDLRLSQYVDCPFRWWEWQYRKHNDSGLPIDGLETPLETWTDQFGIWGNDDRFDPWRNWISRSKKCSPTWDFAVGHDDIQLTTEDPNYSLLAIKMIMRNGCPPGGGSIYDLLYNCTDLSLCFIYLSSNLQRKFQIYSWLSTKQGAICSFSDWCTELDKETNPDIAGVPIAELKDLCKRFSHDEPK